MQISRYGKCEQEDKGERENDKATTDDNGNISGRVGSVAIMYKLLDEVLRCAAVVSTAKINKATPHTFYIYYPHCKQYTLLLPCNRQPQEEKESGESYRIQEKGKKKKYENKREEVARAVQRVRKLNTKKFHQKGKKNCEKQRQHEDVNTKRAWVYLVYKKKNEKLNKEKKWQKKKPHDFIAIGRCLI